MDLRSGHSYWLLSNGIIAAYPPLTSNQQADVVVIGAGITGALITRLFARQGIDVLVLDRREVGWGSTSASTALLQYEIDTDLVDLQEMIGVATAVRAYHLGVEAIDALEKVVGTLQQDCHFMRLPSIYTARTRQGERKLRKEFAARQSAGLDVSYYSGEDLQSRYGITARAAIVSAVGAEFDPFRTTHQIFQEHADQGGHVYDRTEVTEIRPTPQGVEIHTDRGYCVQAKKVIFATGYEATEWLRQPVAKLLSTFACVTEPIAEPRSSSERYLLWEAARPYFYLRSTADRRLIFGGADEPFRNPIARDRLINKKRKALVRLFSKFYPEEPEPEIAYSWAGTFGETKDGLAYIGESPEWPNAYFALGYGGNGVTYSMIAARILLDLYCGRPNADAWLFRFDR
jgi:glycine/D-amino acid oxidase-like deaminating enzyme